MYYLISFLYKTIFYYCIWFSGDEDYVLSKECKLIVYDNIKDIMEYALNNNISLEKESLLVYDIDNLLEWCKDKSKKNIDCSEVLNCWNICSDVARSLEKVFSGSNKVYDELYEKIFEGNNVFNDDVIYIPQFSKSELHTIKNILTDGIQTIIEGLV